MPRNSEDSSTRLTHVFSRIHSGPKKLKPRTLIFQDRDAFNKFLRKRPLTPCEVNEATTFASWLKRFRFRRYFSTDQAADAIEENASEITNLELREHLPWNTSPMLVAKLCQLYDLRLSRLVELIQGSLSIASISGLLPKPPDYSSKRTVWEVELTHIPPIEIWLQEVRTCWLELPNSLALIDMNSAQLSVKLRTDPSAGYGEGLE